MELTFWGVRGTAPVCGKDQIKYGGHTPCASIFSSKREIMIIDAGTGIMRLGDGLIKKMGKKPICVHLFLTHFHIDHIMGIPFFGPLYSRKTRIVFYSPLIPVKTKKLLSRLMESPFFPISFEETKSEKKFIKVPSNSFHIGDVQISHIPLNHPQGSYAYRFRENGKSIVFATDTEHPEKGMDLQLVFFAKGAHIFVYDSTFTPNEYIQSKKGWGHSTWLEGTKIARQAEVRRLYLSHFNPSHLDKEIDDIINSARNKFSETYGAKEGLTEEL